MGIVSVTTIASTTETITKTKLNGLAANLVTEFNGSIENVNVKANAGIDASKLNLATVVQNVNFTGTVKGIPQWKNYTLTTQGIAAGTFYGAGFYNAPAADANLTQASTTVNLGTANLTYAAHAFLVAGGAGSASGGSGAVTIVVSGTSITDAGVRTTTDTETIVSDITAMSLNEYFETTKKWIGQVVYTLTVGATGHTTYSADFNYGFAKYEDFGNRDFTITDFEVTGLAGATDSGFNIELLHHKATGWTYHATAFSAGSSAIINQNTVHNTETELGNGIPFAFKRTGLSQAIDGDGSEGIVIRLTTVAANAIQYLQAHLGAKVS